MQRYIEKKYEQKTGNAFKNIPKYDYRSFIIYENKYAKKFRRFIESKGGKLLTPYFSAKKEVKIICEKGHQWTTTPDSIHHNNWCSHCANNIKGNAELYQIIANKFNCELISEYINAKSPIEFKCSKGHKFSRIPYWLKRVYRSIDSICPNCKLDIYAKKFKTIIDKKGGELLTQYNGRFKIIKIKCRNNHIWKTTPAIIYQGSWCRLCKN